MSDPTADEDEDDPGLLVKASFALGIPLPTGVERETLSPRVV